jgi:hypothetical protein
VWFLFIVFLTCVAKCNMQNVISKLVKQKEGLQNELKLVSTAIESLQKVCPHQDGDGFSTMDSEGHGSHKEYFKCTICGKRDSV